MKEERALPATEGAGDQPTTELECPCCGDVGARADMEGFFHDGDRLVCGCYGWVTADGETLYISGVGDEPCPKCEPAALPPVQAQEPTRGEPGCRGCQDGECPLHLGTPSNFAASIPGAPVRKTPRLQKKDGCIGSGLAGHGWTNRPNIGDRCDCGAVRYGDVEMAE